MHLTSDFATLEAHHHFHVEAACPLPRHRFSPDFQATAEISFSSSTSIPVHPGPSLTGLWLPLPPYAQAELSTGLFCVSGLIYTKTQMAKD